VLSYIYMALRSFRGVFSRHSTWLVFSMVVLGFIGATEIVGITSFCRFWGLGESAYNTFLHFFHSNAWSLDALICQWTTFVLAQNLTVMVQGRALLLGDHTYVPKDGRRMPGVVTLHQDSETQSKPSYFRGHCWGAISLVIGSLAQPFGLPLDLSIHQGLIHIGHQAEENNETLGTRIVQMALDFAIRHNLPCVLTLDAFFPGAAVFNLAYSIWSIKLQQPLVTLIIRAKKNCVAYFEAEKPEEKKPGRPAKYGKKVRLKDLFDDLHLFSKAECRIYGKVEEVSIMVINLLWKPTGRMIRFVLAVTSRGPIVLMCSDLNQTAVLALELYCARTRVEIMFDMLKNLIGAFQYRFWSKLMPRHSRKPKKNKDLKKPCLQALQTVRHCWEACERFVMLGAISLGLLEIIAVKYTKSIWNCYDGFLRTRSRELPSERTVKHVIARLILRDFLISVPRAIMQEIRERYFGQKFPPQRSRPSAESQDRIAAGL
jgi:hypothetical protein